MHVKTQTGTGSCEIGKRGVAMSHRVFTRTVASHNSHSSRVLLEVAAHVHRVASLLSACPHAAPVITGERSTRGKRAAPACAVACAVGYR